MHGSLDDLKVEIDMLAPGGERIVGKSPPLDIIARDIIFGEGPVWDARGKQLYFTDIIGDTIWKWKPKSGLEALMMPSVKADGLALDLEYRVVVAGWGGRTVFRIEKDGSRTTLMDHWEGKKLNSPNDIIVSKDGAIWYTDPVGGLFNVGMVGEDLQRYNDKQPVYRIAPDGKQISLMIDDIVYPNGLCFSPDEKLLYVNCSRERLIRVYDVKPGATNHLGKGRLFYQYRRPRTRRAGWHEVRRRRQRLLHRPGRHLRARHRGQSARADQDAGAPPHQLRLGRRRLALAVYHQHRFRGAHAIEYSRCSRTVGKNE